jgi:hypothetical protein
MSAQITELIEAAEAIAAEASKDAYMPAHSWGYGQLSMLIDRTRLHGTPPAMKHCDCLGCSAGAQHVAAVSR